MEEKVIDVFLTFTRDSEGLFDIAKRELEYVNNTVVREKRIVFQAHDWKNCSIAGMGNLEDRIRKQFSIDNFCIFVGIFRFDFENMKPSMDKMFELEIEEEFYHAWQCKKENRTPEIMIYKSAEKMIPRDVALQGNLKKNDKFFEEFTTKGKYPVLYKEFESEADFAIEFRTSIFRCFMDYWEKELEKRSPRIGKELIEKGYRNIFINEDNEIRNKLKREEIGKTKELRLHAKSCHAFLARGIVFYEAIRKALENGMQFKAIMQNPWS